MEAVSANTYANHTPIENRLFGHTKNISQLLETGSLETLIKMQRRCDRENGKKCSFSLSTPDSRAVQTRPEWQLVMPVSRKDNPPL